MRNWRLAAPVQPDEDVLLAKLGRVAVEALTEINAGALLTDHLREEAVRSKFTSAVVALTGFGVADSLFIIRNQNVVFTPVTEGRTAVELTGPAA